MTRIANPPPISKREVVTFVRESGVAIAGCIFYLLAFAFISYFSAVLHWWGFMIFLFVAFGVPLVLLVLGWPGIISFVSLAGVMEWVTAKAPPRPASERLVIALYGILLLILIVNYLLSA